MNWNCLLTTFLLGYGISTIIWTIVLLIIMEIKYAWKEILLFFLSGIVALVVFYNL